jgi:hypothetical protein
MGGLIPTRMLHELVEGATAVLKLTVRASGEHNLK